MSPGSETTSAATLIVGAGLSGLLAARELRAHGLKRSDVVLLEAAGVVGGRVASDDAGPARFDSGAQFFTVRFARFRKLVEEWTAAGVAAEWGRGFAGASGQPRRDGHPRYRGLPHMAAIPHYLARDLDVRLSTKVVAAAPSASSLRRAQGRPGQAPSARSGQTLRDGRWRLSLADGSELDGSALLLTPPLPVSLALLEAGGTALPAQVRDRLASVRYQPCIAMLATLAGPSGLPSPGAVQLHGEPLAFIADNTQKGVSPAVPAVTIHAGPRFSADHWRADPEEVAARLLDESSYWVRSPAQSWRLRYWPHSAPADTFPERALAVPQLPGLYLAGDVFGGPRVEGASLSGLAAAQLILAAARP